MPNSSDETRTIHGLTSGLTIPLPSYGRAGQASGVVLYAGQTVTLNAEQIEDTRDRWGASWLDLDEAGQLERWGEVKFAEGPAPEGTIVGSDDTGVMSRAYDREMALAMGHSRPQDREVAIRELRAKYGAGRNPSGQHTLHLPGEL